MASPQQEKPKKLPGMSGPQPMVMNGNLATQWKKWIQAFKLYLRASGMGEESDDRKVALFLHTIGDKGVDIFNTFGKNEETIEYDELIELFQKYFAPKANLTYACHNFFTCKQSDNESLDDFVCKLKLKSQDCGLNELQERLVKVMFICNMHQKYNFIREKLLLEDTLDLDKALEVAKAMMASRSHTDELAEQTVLYNVSQSRQSRSRSKSQSNHKQSSKNCTRCGQVHRQKCPALGVKCRKCGKIGHFAICCLSGKSKTVKYVESDNKTEQVQSEELFIGHIQSSKSSSSEWSINLTINNSQINCIIDTGSDVNIMSKDVYESLNIKNTLSETNVKIKSYTGNSLEVLGQQNLKCKFKFDDTYMSKDIDFIIANVSSPTVLGKLTCSEIGLVKRVFCVDTNKKMSDSNSSQKLCSKVSQSPPQSSSVQSSQSCQSYINLNKLIECNNSVFTGLGCLPGECHINTNPEVQPKVDAPRKVPFALHSRLQQELEKMEKMDVIEKVTEPTEWYVIGSVTSWNILAGISATVPILSLLTMLFVPETPNYLLTQDKRERAESSLAKLRGSTYNLNEEIQRMITFKEKNHVEPLRGPREIVKALLSPSALKPFSILATYFFLYQWCGVNTITFYAVEVFEASGASLNKYWLTISMGIIRVIFTVIGCILCRRCGRRPLTFVSAIGCGTTMIALAVYMYFVQYWRENNLQPVHSWIPVAAIYIFTISCTLGYLIVPWVMIGEVYPTQVRGIVGGMTTCAAHMSVFSVVKTFPYLKYAFNDYGTFALYGSMSILGTVFYYFYLPETKGRTLQEIEDYFCGRTKTLKKTQSTETA